MKGMKRLSYGKGPPQNLVTSVKWNSFTFIAGTTMSKALLTRGANRSRERFHVGEQFNQALVETEIPYSSYDMSAVDENSSVTSHAGHDLLIGVDFADVPQSCYQEAARRRSDHLIECRIAAGNHDVHGRFTDFVRQWKPMPGWLDPGLAGRLAAVGYLSDGSSLY